MAQGSNWGPMWDEAAAKYKEQRKKYAEDHISWVSKHIKKKPKNGKILAIEFQEIPDFDDGEDFSTAFNEEIGRRRDEFGDMRAVGAAVANAMLALSTPLKALMDQASAVGGMFFPGTPMIYSGLVYLFDACRGVTGYFDVIEQLMTECHKFIKVIAIQLESRKGIRSELKDNVIGCLVGFLNICRITRTAVKEKKLKSWFEQLYKEKGGEARAALQDLQDLARERDSHVASLTLRSVDNIEDDVVEIKSGVIALKSSVADVKTGMGNLYEVNQGQTQLMLQILRQKLPDQAESRTKQGTSKESKKLHRDRDQLRRFLDPDIRTADRLLEIQQSTATGTCDWILQNSEYIKFVSDKTSHVLWISGEPGVGKSHLAARIIKDLEDQLIMGEEGAFKPSCASFFCDFEIGPSLGDFNSLTTAEINAAQEDSDLDQAASDSDSGYDGVSSNSGASGSERSDEDPVLKLPVAEVLKTLAWELTEKERAYEIHLIQRQSAMKTSTIRELWDGLFDNGYFTRRPCFLVIDGLDTITEEERIILYGCIKGLTFPNDMASSNFKVVLLGRSDATKQLEASLESSVARITVTERENEKDIRQFVWESLKEVPKYSKVLKNAQFADQYLNKILEASQGNFELAALLVKQLLKKDHLNVIQATFDQSDHQVADVLREILQNFGQTHELQDIEDLNRLLAWTLCAQRPMTLAELNMITAVESSYGAFLDIRPKIQTHFLSFFSIVDKSRKTITYQRKFGAGKEAETASEAEIEDEDTEAATLRLAHSSVADFFKRSEKVVISGKGIAIGIDQREAHLRIAKTCLEVLCTTELLVSSPFPDNPASILKYASFHFIHHLEFLLQDENIDSLSLEDKIGLATKVIKLFRDDVILGRWWFLSFETKWPHWFGLPGPLQSVWKLISDDAIRDQLQAEDQVWIEDPSTPICEKLLRRPAMFVSASWLGQISPLDVKNTYFYHLEAMVNLFKVPDEDFKASPLVETQPRFPKPPYSKKWKPLANQRILRAAEWAGFEKTPVWYIQIGTMLKGEEEPIALYNKAIDLSASYGPAYYTLAIKLSAQEHYAQAIVKMEEAQRLGIFEGDNRLYDDVDYPDANSVTWIAYWQKELGNHEDGLRTLERGLDERKNNFSILFDFVEMAFEMGRYSQIMARLQMLEDETLSKFLNYDEGIQNYLRKAAQQAKRTDFLKAAIIASLEQAQKDHCDDEDIIALKMALASVFAENQEEDKAIEQIREVYELDQVSRQPSFSAQWCAGLLAELYFIKASALRTGSPQYNTCIAELREMEKREHSPFGGDISTDQSDAGLLLGLLLRQERKDEEARPFFKDRIALSLAMLEDDDLDNDADAWCLLGFALCKSGDLLNGEAAIACWATEANDEEDEGDDDDATAENGEKDDAGGSQAETGDDSTSGDIKDQSSSDNGDDKDEDKSDGAESESHEELKPGDADKKAENRTTEGRDAQDVPAPDPQYELQHTVCSFLSCEGPCNAQFEDHPKIAYICVHCFYTAFCSDCLPLLQSMPCKKCDPMHTRIPLRFSPKDLPENKIIVDGKLRDLSEWKSEIRTNWGLPDAVLKQAASNSAQLQTDLPEQVERK